MYDIIILYNNSIIYYIWIKYLYNVVYVSRSGATLLNFVNRKIQIKWGISVDLDILGQLNWIFNIDIFFKNLILTVLFSSWGTIKSFLEESLNSYGST